MASALGIKGRLLPSVQVLGNTVNRPVPWSARHSLCGAVSVFLHEHCVAVHSLYESVNGICQANKTTFLFWVIIDALCFCFVCLFVFLEDRRTNKTYLAV